MEEPTVGLEMACGVGWTIFGAFGLAFGGRGSIRCGVGWTTRGLGGWAGGMRADAIAARSSGSGAYSSSDIVALGVSRQSM